jgi:hypothetical protein
MLASSGIRRRAAASIDTEPSATTDLTSATQDSDPALVAADAKAALPNGKPAAAASSSATSTGSVTITISYRLAAFVALLLVLFGALAGGLGGAVMTLKTVGSNDHPTIDKGVVYLIGKLGLRFSVSLGDDDDEDEEEIVSCTADQPLVERTPDLVPRRVFDHMQSCLVGHPEVRTNQLSEGFAGTRGFVIHFSGDGGVARFRNETKYNCGDFNPLLPFFDAAHTPGTNGFVMNILVCDQGTNSSSVVVRQHVDNTLRHTKPNTDFLAHTVSVLYISVPEDMVGGQLELLGIGEEHHTNPDHVVDSVHPVEDYSATFRGDSYHQVRGYDTATDTLRISLVLEQYKLDEENAPYMIEYEQSEKDGMTMM